MPTGDGEGGEGRAAANALFARAGLAAGGYCGGRGGLTPEERCEVREGLARAGFRGHEDVTARRDRRHRGTLHCRRLSDTSALEPGADLGAQSYTKLDAQGIKERVCVLYQIVNVRGLNERRQGGGSRRSYLGAGIARWAPARPRWSPWRRTAHGTPLTRVTRGGRVTVQEPHSRRPDPLARAFGGPTPRPRT